MLKKNFTFFGISVLLVEIILLNFVLLWLRGRPNQSGAAVLAMGNLLLGLVALLPLKRLRALPRPSKKMILIWSLSYCFTYDAFVMLPALLPLSALRSAQTVAPTAAVFVTGDWRSERTSILEIGTTVLALLVLLSVVFTQDYKKIGGAGLILFFAIALSYVASQSAARVLSKDVPPWWTSVHLSLANGVILEIVLIVQRHTIVSGQIIRDGLLLASFIVAVQVPLLFGLRWTPPLLAGLTLASAVPVAVLFEAVLARHAPSLAVTIVSIVFVTLMGIVSVLRKRREHAISTVSEITLSWQEKK